MSDPDYGARADLLTPVLHEDNPPEPMYSARAEFFTAFFGGPFAILILSALNSRILGRLDKDKWRYVLGAVASFGVVTGAAYIAVMDTPPEWYADIAIDDERRAVRLMSRVFAMGLWFLLWFPYRRYHKTTEMVGTGVRSPWKAALGSGGVGLGLIFLITFVVSRIA